uniref:Uncharacterized protein n=1 Tax=Loigolactobacillus rennini TaxID=238013 RepID=A0A1K2I3Q5_9LACO|nr:hypothetical protein LREN565_0083 [Loigolactobacillus rennini]
MVNKKNQNYSRIFNLIYENKKISKQEIARRLNLSLPTVTENLEKLKKRKLVQICGKFESQVGRKARAYTIFSNAYISLGAEIFKNHVTISALNLIGAEIATDTKNLIYSNNDTYFSQLANWIQKFVVKNQLENKNILGIGLGVQGLVSHNGKKILWSKILQLSNLTTRPLEKYLPYPIFFYHDADCVATAEQFSAHTNQDTTYLSIGEHLGTAIIINNQIYSGENGRSGTMEHITLNTRSDRKCYCGRYGCIETYCSINSLLSQGETMDNFINNLKAGNKLVKKRWNDYLNFLAEAINNIHMFLDNRLVIAGDLIRYLNTSIINDLDERIKKITAFPEDHSYLDLGTITTRSVALGAAITIIKSFLETI